ncbi:hypothetical protein L1987_00476 [Smallanthus sonchifolius]|uniref:Uncharacterized protein n=1 Tax=Smallanthus sonchifolius TaxID=185202 RepID=A0ACB9K2G0_9ASTR|nr:hypothetical protein L1987_00476 [Smallanthus sonchifolius]
MVVERVEHAQFGLKALGSSEKAVHLHENFVNIESNARNSLNTTIRAEKTVFEELEKKVEEHQGLMKTASVDLLASGLNGDCFYGPASIGLNGPPGLLAAG